MGGGGGGGDDVWYLTLRIGQGRKRIKSVMGYSNNKMLSD